MQIDIKGRNVPVTDEIRMHAERRLNKVARQVSDLARLEIEIFKEPNPRVADCHVAEGTLYLKRVTLRARDASPELLHSLNLMVDELARQVKRHRDKLRHRRDRSDIGSAGEDGDHAAAVERVLAIEATRAMARAVPQATI
jgi:ribosome hibernation promoting factor